MTWDQVRKRAELAFVLFLSARARGERDHYAQLYSKYISLGRSL